MVNDKLQATASRPAQGRVILGQLFGKIWALLSAALEEAEVEDTDEKYMTGLEFNLD